MTSAAASTGAAAVPAAAAAARLDQKNSGYALEARLADIMKAVRGVFCPAANLSSGDYYHQASPSSNLDSWALDAYASNTTQPPASEDNEDMKPAADTIRAVNQSLQWWDALSLEDITPTTLLTASDVQQVVAPNPTTATPTLPLSKELYAWPTMLRVDNKATEAKRQRVPSVVPQSPDGDSTDNHADDDKMSDEVKERRRQSARQCRARKTTYLRALEQENAMLRSENTALRVAADGFQKHVGKLPRGFMKLAELPPPTRMLSLRMRPRRINRRQQQQQQQTAGASTS
eukprot:jgi/Chlat1/3206/Chrsp22S03491